MKKHPVLSVVVALIFLGLPFAASFGKGTDVSADAALKALKEGNERYTQAKQTHPNAGKDRRTATTVNGQSPFASILSCSDSRVPLEIIFDQGIGDLFVVRVAGNQANVD